MAEHGPLDKKQIIILQALYYMNQEQRRAILRKADVALVRCICECALNVLQGNVSLNSVQKDRLRRHATILRRLAAKRGNWSGKRRLIVEHSAGFLKLLLLSVLEYMNHGTR